MPEKTVLVDPSVEYKDNMFFITYDEDTAWIEDWRDASHMETIPIAISSDTEEDIPKLIAALQRVLNKENDLPPEEDLS